MTAQERTPQTAEELRAAILDRYEGLSKRLQQIARYVLDEPNEVALETLAVIADRSGVQPSAIVRFAKSFGFDGATQMQRLFRDGLLSSHAALGYSERVREFTSAVDAKPVSGPAEILAEFIEGSTLSLRNLAGTVDAHALDKAVGLISAASTVYVVGFRRAFGVAAYLVYSLQQAGKRTVFVDGVAGLHRNQIQFAGPDDLVIAVSFHPYAEETIQAVEDAGGRGAKVLAISDTLVGGIARSATMVLQVREAEVRKFRSLTASMCLAQALVIAFIFQTPPAGGRSVKGRAKA